MDIQLIIVLLVPTITVSLLHFLYCFAVLCYLIITLQSQAASLEHMKMKKNVPKESKENGKRIKRSYCSIKSSNTGRRRRRRQNQNMNRCSNSRFNVLFRCAMPNLLLLNEQYRTMQYILQICSIQAQSIQCVILKY